MAYLQKVQRPTNSNEPPPEQDLSPSIERLLRDWEAAAPEPVSDAVAKIEVHDTVSNVAWAYEKLRQAIDYQDEHLLRKNAIERILKRRLVAGVTANQIAEPLVLELIRGRYLPNKSVTVTQVEAAEDIINRYVHLWSQVPNLPDPKEAERLFEWYLGLMAVQLNELFSPEMKDELMANLMHRLTHQDITFAAEEIDEATKNTLLYVAIHRALLKSDSNIIRYHLFTRQHPEWKTATEETVYELGHRLPEIRDQVEALLLHSAGELLQRLMKKYAIIFHVFRDVLEDHGENATALLKQPDQLANAIETAYTRRRKKVTWKIARNVIRSIIYVFLTKMLLTLLIELPIDRFLYGEDLSYLPLIINTAFPPVLLLLIGITIRPPGKKNEQAVVEKVKTLVYQGDQRHSLVKPRKPLRRSSIFTYFYRLFYALTFIIVFGGLMVVLTNIGFTPVSTFIFILFLTIVSFFGIRVRLLARELLVVDQRENIFTIIFDFFTVPILQVGRWISLRAPRINVLIFFLDVIIEAPFKATLNAIEGFLGFLREKREEIY